MPPNTAAAAAIAFQAEPNDASTSGGRRRAQRWVAIDTATGAPVPARRVFAALASPSSGVDVARALLDALQGCPFDAAFWECPPLLPTDILSPIDDDGDSNGGFEFMLVDAPELLVSLEGGADPRPFWEHLGSGAGRAEVRCFANLGWDADLVSPTQATSTDDYGHLIGFVRSETVPKAQKLALLEGTGRAVIDRCQRRRERHEESRPVWVSTSGLGVAWLHVRVEDRPKYYTWGPYVERAGDGAGAGGKSGRRYG